MVRILRAALLSALVSVPASAGVLYVDSGAAGTNDGSSWTNAFTGVQAALAAAVPGDEIWVAAGTYRPTSTTDRTVSFALKEGVGIYGGFDGTETLRDERDPHTRVTTLSGDIGASPDSADNSYHVVRSEDDVTASGVLDGFTITGGRANGTGDDGYGGGMLVSGGSPTLTDLKLDANQAEHGGGLAIKGGSPHLTGSSVAANAGGGLWSSASFSCRDCVVRSNSGHGIACRGTVTLANTVIAGNSGRGIDFFFTGTATIASSTIAHNGGAGISVITLPEPVGEAALALSVRNTIIWGNAGGIVASRGLGFPPPGVTYSDVQGWTLPGTGNIRVDPLFLAPPGDLRLGPGSPAVDAGNNLGVPAGVTTDVAGLPRFRDDPDRPDTGAGTPPIVDMGAHERAAISVTAPTSLALCLGEDAVFSVSGSGAPPIAYQWRRDQAPLSNGGRVSGADSPTLTIADTEPGDSGVYDVVATNGNGETMDSANATLTVGAHVRNPVVTAPRSVPAFSSDHLASVPKESGSSWTWSLSGGKITSGEGTNAITFTAGDAGTTMLLAVTDHSWSCPTPDVSVRIPVDFLDVPTDDPFHGFVAAIAAAGITAGCGGGSYCRDKPVTREQMAAFLLKAKHGASYAPPHCSGTFFDVPCPSLFADWVERLASEGISVGCGGGNYCAGDPVTRAQMAVFLIKTLTGPAYLPPPCTGVFDDVPCSHLYSNWIEELHNRSITDGCSATPRLYCPSNPVTRGQMAVFLTKAFELPLP